VEGGLKFFVFERKGRTVVEPHIHGGGEGKQKRKESTVLQVTKEKGSRLLDAE